ncbi:hypothetical protein [Herminiimonas sp. CN]|uniref:hypothetical protein n=1 Tax=Herminiimonas sp. CN TaxID=1349818 RepID=UPI0012DDBD29|nr:hypothetical protein [Herminiimonas sp. CN]
MAEAQRASFDYFSGIHTVPQELPAAGRCSWLLSQGSMRSDEGAPGAGWRKVWEGNRPGDRHEKFRLYRRNGQHADR